MSTIAKAHFGFITDVKPGEPYYNDVKALLHFDGTSGSATFTDQKAHTFTAVEGSPVLSNAQSLAGGTSLRFSTSITQAVGSGYESDFQFTSLWTVEFFVRPDSLPGNRCLFSWGPSGTPAARNITVGSTGALIVRQSGSAIISLGGHLLTAAAWHHVALTRDGTTIRLFVNGILDGSATPASLVSATANALRIGANPAIIDGALFGYVEDFRFTANIARYTANFTPPVAPFLDHQA